MVFYREEILDQEILTMQGLWAFLAGLIKAIMAALVYYAGREQGLHVEKIEQQEDNYEAMQEQIRKIENRPVTDADFNRLFERAKVEASKRENTKP